MIDKEMLDEFLKHLADRYTAAELVEILGLTEWDILGMFEDRVVELNAEDYV